jgi:hypothetical protein
LHYQPLSRKRVEEFIAEGIGTRYRSRAAKSAEETEIFNVNW